MSSAHLLAKSSFSSWDASLDLARTRSALVALREDVRWAQRVLVKAEMVWAVVRRCWRSVTSEGGGDGEDVKERRWALRWRVRRAWTSDSVYRFGGMVWNMRGLG